MARILCLTWPGGGNQPPEIGLAQELQRRGHSVTFAGYEPQRERFAAVGFPLVLLERASAAYGAHDVLQGQLQDVFVSEDHLHDLPEAIARTRCDALVVDCLMFGALTAAEDAGLPTAALVHSAPGTGLNPGSWLEGALLPRVNALRAADGKADLAQFWAAWARFPTLCATLRELDPLADQTPPSFAYVGPIFEQAPATGWRSPWPDDDPRPLVVVSFSTHGAWDQTSRLQRTFDALAGCPLRALVTTGVVDPARLSPPPANVVVTRSAPHAEVMPLAAACVTHAGHGTLTAALAAGTPVVCLPNSTFGPDQLALAARVAALGAGIALDGDTCAPDEIAAAVEQVLAEPHYREAARRLAASIASAPGATNAADRLEALMR